MVNVRRIDWRVRTGDQWWNGTDDTVKIEIYRDLTLLKRLNLEPGNTSRLNKSENVNYFWEFKDPDGVGTSVSGVTVPFTVSFPAGIEGHLRVKLVAKGDDAWKKISIDSTVTTGKLVAEPGTIDGVAWVEDEHSFLFNQVKVLSTDSDEGVAALNLNYV